MLMKLGCFELTKTSLNFQLGSCLTSVAVRTHWLSGSQIDNLSSRAGLQVDLRLQTGTDLRLPRDYFLYPLKRTKKLLDLLFVEKKGIKTTRN